MRFINVLKLENFTMIFKFWKKKYSYYPKKAAKYLFHLSKFCIFFGFQKFWSIAFYIISLKFWKNFIFLNFHNFYVASETLFLAYERQIENFNAMSEQAANLGKTLAERSQKAKDANAELAKVKYHQAQEIKAVEQNIVELVQNEKELSTRAEKALQESKRIQSVMGDVRDAVQETDTKRFCIIEDYNLTFVSNVTS